MKSSTVFDLTDIANPVYVPALSPSTLTESRTRANTQPKMKLTQGVAACAEDQRFVRIPKLDEDIVGVVAEHTARMGVELIVVPAYWILKKGTNWSPAYEKVQNDEKSDVVLSR